MKKPPDAAPSPEPLRSKPLAVFAVQALLLSLLIGWWPTPRALYPPLLRAQAGALLSGHAGGVVELRASDGKKAEVDTQMLERLPEVESPRWVAELSLLRLGWWPTAVLAALLLATPMSNRRRALALLAGFVWMELYVFARLWAEIFYADYGIAGGAAVRRNGILQQLLQASDEVLEANAVLIAVVLLAWVVLARPGRAFDASSLRRLLTVRRKV